MHYAIIAAATLFAAGIAYGVWAALSGCVVALTF